MLNPAQTCDRVHDIVTRARKAGADAADAVMAADQSVSVSVRMGALEDVERSESAELGLRVFVGKRSASVSTSDLSSASMDTLVERVLAMAREAPEDRWAGLAPEAMLLGGAAPDLDLDDGGEAEPQSLKDRALAAEEAARAVPGVTNSEGGSASANRAVTALATSHGFTGGYAVTSHSLYASVLAGAGGAMERDYAYHSARHAATLEAPEQVGRRAGERAVSRLGSGRVASGAMPVVFDRRVSSSLIGHLIAAISGASITRKTSFLLESLGKQIFAPGISICDDPLRAQGLRSRPFDGEGLPVAASRLIDDGTLTSWLLDSASARQLGMAPTGHASRGVAGAPGVSPGNLYMAAGSISPEAMIGEIGDGLLITELIGHGANIVTGDYSRGAVGFRIEKGEVTTPVSEITIAGSLKDMFRAITPANDLEFRFGINAPTLRIDGLTVAGD